MTNERIIELLEIEEECVLRNASGECNRYCLGCDLLQDDTELHEMYTEAIALLKAQEPTECENTTKARIFCCSVCGYEVADIFIDEGRFEYPSINFCPNCGRVVKWE